MKRIIALILSCIIYTILQAQNHIHFPTSNARWSEEDYKVSIQYRNGDTTIYDLLALKNMDTTINSKVYHKLYYSLDTTFSESNYIGGIREYNNVVYYTGNLPYNYPDSLRPKQNAEDVIYDFNLKQGDSVTAGYWDPKIPKHHYVTLVDSILIVKTYRKRINFDYGLPWIEGVGSIRGLLYYNAPKPACSCPFHELLCFRQDNAGVYPDSTCNLIFTSAAEKYFQTESLRIYPNPVFGTLNVDLPGVVQGVISIYDLSGKTILSKSFLNDKFALDLSSFIRGLYLIRIKSGKFIINSKFSKE